MDTLSRLWPLDRVVTIDDLGQLDPALSEGDGESKGVYPLARHAKWLAKIYKQPLKPERVAQLDRLIGVLDQAGTGDQTTLINHTSWPVSRITTLGGETIGCVIPTAPDACRAASGPLAGQFVDIDILAKSDAATFTNRGIQPPTAADRLAVCRSIATVAELLERHRIIYSDWSYSNAFWNIGDKSAFIIDVDGCEFVTHDNIFQPNWTDPLTPRGTRADAYTDRYRVALLIARCMTGVRDQVVLLHELASIQPPSLASVLTDVLRAVDRVRRPTTGTLRAALNGLPYQRIPLDLRPLPDRPAGPLPAGKTATGAAGAGKTATGKTAAGAAEAGKRAGRRRKKLLVAAVILIAVVLAVIFAAT